MNRRPRPERSDADDGDRPVRRGRPAQGRPAPGGKPGAGADKPARAAKPARADKAARADKPARAARADKPERTERPARRERTSHGKRGDPNKRPISGGRTPNRKNFAADDRGTPGDRPAFRGRFPARGEGASSERPSGGRRPTRAVIKPVVPRQLNAPPKAAKDRRTSAMIWVPGPTARTIKAEVGLDLAHYVANLTKGRLSIRQARTVIEDGCCRINGQVESFGSYKLVAGDVIEVILPQEDTEHVYDVKRLVYADEYFVAYDKPAFLPVTPIDKIKSWSLVDILKASLGEIIPVHRLDADTSGIVLFARQAKVARRLEEAFAEHQVEKIYHAIVRGHPREAGNYRSYLIKVRSGQGFEKWKSGRGADAREAITNWTVERRLGPYASLVRVEPKTGRYHQIRIHFSEMGASLYGDRIYGDRRDPVHVHRHLLHASEVHFKHPIDESKVVIKSPLPRDMVEAMARLAKI